MDLRIRKTYRALNGAFTTLLAKDRYENISVAALCEEAMIRRTTFYKHFRDKDDYFAFFIANLREEFLDLGSEKGGERREQSERREILRRLADFLLEHEALMDNIFESSMSGAMTNVISDAVTEALRERYGIPNASEEEMSELDLAAEFSAGGIVRLMTLWWHSDRLGDGPDAFVEAADQLLGRVMEG